MEVKIPLESVRVGAEDVPHTYTVLTLSHATTMSTRSTSETNVIIGCDTEYDLVDGKR